MGKNQIVDKVEQLVNHINQLSIDLERNQGDDRMKMTPPNDQHQLVDTNGSKRTKN